MDTWLILMVIASTLGGVLIGVLGWLKQKPSVPFDVRGFLVSVISSLIAGAIYVVTLATKTDNLTKDFIIAAVFGAGGDMAIRGAVGTVVTQTSKQPTLPTPTIPPTTPPATPT